MFKILFVCTGNTCRSAMAAPLLEKLLIQALGEDKVRARVRIESAGVGALKGVPASNEAVVVMGREGIDLSAHRSTLLEKEEIAKADLILVMTGRHKEIVLGLAPAAKEKVYTLVEYANPGESGDIFDPFAQGVEAYEKCLQSLKGLLKVIVPRIIKDFNIDVKE